MLPHDAVGFLAANIILPVLATIAVILRFYSRKLVSLPFGSDDWVILVTLVLAILICAQGIYSAFSGLAGVNIVHMSPATYERYNIVLFISILIAHIVFGLVKIAVLLFYKRVFSVRSTGTFRLLANFGIVIVSGWIIAAFFTMIGSSKGVSSYWTTPLRLDGTQYNYNYSAFLTGMIAIDIVFDVLILCLPFPIIFSLQMNPARKVLLGLLFVLGFFCIIASGIRLNYGIKLKNFLAKNPFDTSDTASKLIGNEDLWSRIEGCASIIAACLPTLRPLLPLKTLKSITSSRRKTYSTSNPPLQSGTNGTTGKDVVPSRDTELQNLVIDEELKPWERNKQSSNTSEEMV